MSEWILANTPPQMALEVARAAYLRSLHAGQPPELAYQSVIQALRDIVPDPNIYADHVMGEKVRVGSICQSGIYHKGSLVFQAADIAELAARKREQIMARPDIAEMGKAHIMENWDSLEPHAADVFFQWWMGEHKDWVEAERKRLMNHSQDDAYVEQQLDNNIFAEVKGTWNMKANEHNNVVFQKQEMHSVIERVLSELPDEGFKLFDFAVREIKRERFFQHDTFDEDVAEQAMPRQVKVISDAAVLMNELAKRNKPAPNINAKDFTMENLEDWVYSEENETQLRGLKADDFEIGPGYDSYNDKIVYKMKDGWTIRELPADRDDVETEGRDMQHCLQDCDSYHWDEKIGQGYSRMFSLRDPLNYPHGTIEFVADRGMAPRDTTWYINQMYGKQDKSIKMFPAYWDRIEQWFRHLKSEYNINVEEGGYHSGDFYPEGEEPREPEHLDGYDETLEGDVEDINDAWDLDKYYTRLENRDAGFFRSDGEQENDEDGDYWYIYTAGTLPQIDDPGGVAKDIFEQIGNETEDMAWGYRMMEALLFACEHAMVQYGGVGTNESNQILQEVSDAAQAVTNDARWHNEDPNQLDFQDSEEPGSADFAQEEPEEFHGITHDGAQRVEAAMTYFAAICTGTNLYGDGFLPSPDENYFNISKPERAFTNFQDSEFKPYPENGETPEQGPPMHGHPETQPLAPGTRGELGPKDEEGNATGWQIGRPEDWREQLYHQEMTPPAPDGTIDEPNIIGTGVHPALRTPGVTDRFGGQMGWTPSGHVFVNGDTGDWRPMAPGGYHMWEQGMRAQMAPITPQVHPDFEAYRQRQGHVVEAADIGQLAAAAFESLIQRADYKKATADLQQLEILHAQEGTRAVNPNEESWPLPDTDIPKVQRAKDLHERIYNHPIKVATRLWGILMRNENTSTYKLWPWAWREIKKGNITQENYRHAIDIIKQGSEMLTDMRQHNRVPRGFDVNQLSLPEFEEWIRENQPDHSDEWEDSETVYSFKDGWSIAKVGPNDCVREGDLMGHCVGGYGDDVERGETEIYSLRDTKGMPHVTLEMHPPKPAMREGMKNFEGTAQAVVQIQGKGNRQPIPEYQQRLKEWFNENNRTTDNTFVWQGYSSDYEDTVINNMPTLYHWWKKLEENPAYWLEGAEGGGIMVTNQTGEYGLPEGYERGESSTEIYVSDWKTLEEYALHAGRQRYSQGDYDRESDWDGSIPELGKALYYLCWVEKESLSEVTQNMSEILDQWGFETTDYSYGYIKEETDNELERVYGDAYDPDEETINGSNDEYQEKVDELRDTLEQEILESEFGDAYKLLTYLYHLEGIYPAHTRERVEPGAADAGERPQYRDVPSQEEAPPPHTMLEPDRAKEEMRLRQLQPSIPGVQPTMLVHELADPVPDEIKHMEDAKEVDRQKALMTPGRMPHPLRYDPWEFGQERLTSLDDALAALSRPMQASSLDWVLEPHPTAPGMWRISNVGISSDGRVYAADEEPRNGYLTHIVANRELLLEGYAVSQSGADITLVSLQ